MGRERAFDAEWTELEKIDFLLNEMARAVERGEMPRSSYDAMVPRYLSRRQQLAAVITAGAAGYSAPRAESSETKPRATYHAQSSQVHGPVATWTSAPVASARPAARHEPRPAPQPVPWTTVLLFVGAFLVIVAAAIFSIVIWDLLGTTGKLAFLGSATAAFYAAGWFVRRRLDVPVGATALTMVASAMLLFDGWTAIEGYGLEGPLPWAVLLLICSAVYWYTEVRLAQRFFGIVGAAAQMGWWWLLGQGLGLPVTLRLAAMAVFAVAWQVASQRAREDSVVGPLALVLEWAAPVTSFLLAVGVAADLALVGSAGPTEVAAAAVVSLSAWFVLATTRHLADLQAHALAAMVQIPLFGAFVIASDSSGASGWWLGAFVALAIAYGAYALLRGGYPFAVLAVFAELSALLQLLALVDANDRISVASLAALAALWALASRLARRVARMEGAPVGAEPIERVAAWASFALLVIASLAVPVVGGGVPLAGIAVRRSDAALAGAVFLAWAASAVIRRRKVFVGGAATFSFYAVSALVASIAPSLASAYYALGLVVVAFAWLFAAGGLERPFDQRFAEAFRWVMRGTIVFVAAIGLEFEIVLNGNAEMSTWPAVALAGAAAATLAYDAFFARNPASSGVSSTLAVVVAMLAAGTLRDPEARRIAVAICGSAAAGVIGLLAFVVRGVRPLRMEVAVVAAAAVGTLSAVFAWGWPASLVVALLLVALCWGLAAGRFNEAYALPAGLALMAAAAAGAAAVEAGTWPTVGFVGGSCLVLGSVSLLDAFGPARSHRRAGALLGVAGLIGIAVTASVAFTGAFPSADRAWLGLGAIELAVLLAAFGCSVLLQGWRWGVEAAEYAGWFIILMAAWSAWGEASGTVGEWYTTSLAVYLVAVGYRYVSRDPEHRGYPAVLDAAAVLIGIGLPLLWSLSAGPGSVLTHFLWVLVTSTVAIAAGVMLKVRWYFFGGIVALVIVALYRSFTVMAEFSWLLLGILGIAMLVVAVTWEQQRSTRERLRASFQHWR